MENHGLVNQRLNARFQANPTNRGKSCSHFLLKLLLIGFFLSLIPLFPTEPPEFIRHTIFAQTWELIHLFIIGIALSYGLFCRLKSPQISPKPQISQPYGTNILHHASLFDYEGENQSGNFEKNGSPAQGSNFSYYRTKPYVVVKRENCINFDEKPLGLPVRSLRSRVVESDCSDSDGDEECDSECESELSGKSFGRNSIGILSSGKDQNLDQNVGDFSASSKSRSMRADFMAENRKFEMNQMHSQSFRSPTQGSCQTNYGFCSWLPESPNIMHQPMGMPPLRPSNMEGGNSWRRENFEMPVSSFSTQWHGSSVMGIPTNFEKGNSGWEEGNFYVPSVQFPSSMAAPTNDFVARPRGFTHEEVNLGEPSILENGTSDGERTGFFTPPAASPPSSSVTERDFVSSVTPSRSRRFNRGNVDLGASPNFEHGNPVGEKTGLFMPSAAAPSSASLPDRDFASSIIRSRSRRINNDNGDLSSLPNFEHRNLGGEKTGLFTPAAGATLSASVPENDVASPFEPSRPHRFNYEIGDLSRPPNFEHGTLGCERTHLPKPSAVAAASVSVLDNDFIPSIKASKCRKFSYEIGNAGVSSNFEHGKPSNEKTSSFVPVAAASSPVSAPEKDPGSSLRGSRYVKFNDENGDSGSSPDLDNVNVHGEKTKTVKSSAGEKDTSPSTRLLRSGKASPETKDLVALPNFEKETLGGGVINPPIPSGTDPSSVSAPEKKFGLSAPQEIHPNTCLNKDKEESKVHNVGRLSVVDDYSSHYGSDPIDVSPLKKDEKRSVPTKWDDDCFVTLSPERNEAGNVDQQNPTHESACSPEPPSPASSSSERSSGKQMSLQSKREETVSTDSSEVEELGEDIEAYKPSTPSPPPRVQTLRNDFPSSVESSSNALGNGSLLDYDDDDPESPPTPGSGKALSRKSHSRRFSCTSFFDRDQRRNFKDDHAKEANRKSTRRGNSCGWDCLKLDVKPSLTKAALKGKSVRTIRPRETRLDSEREGEAKREENGGTSMGRLEERKGEKPGMVVIKIGISEKKPSSSSNGNDDQKQGSGSTSIIVGLNSKESSKVKPNDIKEEEIDSDEIDRKADEFIAKFKEQMRLQKVAARAESSSSRRRSSLR